MYIVLRGTAVVDVGGRFHNLEPGEFFGEMALVAGRKRMATVKAEDRVDALRIGAEEFQGFLLHQPLVAVAMLRSLVERLREVQERIDAWAGVW
jgi:CRP-like cAMP-binding protein